MGKATGAQTGLAYVAETTWGTTPASPTMKELRDVSETLEHSRGQLVSEEIKADRMVRNVIHGSRSDGGEISCEFSDGLDDILAAGCYGAFASNILKVGQTLSQFTVERRVQSIGQFMRYTGIRPNGLKLSLAPEAIAKISFPIQGKDLNVAGDALGGPTGWLVNNGAGYAAATASIAIDTGTTNPAALDQFTINKAATPADMRSDQIYTVSGYAAPNLTFSPPLDVAILDNDVLHFVRPATVVSSADPANAFTGTLTEGGSAIAIVTGLDLDLGQGGEPAKVIGANTPQAIIPGGVALTGSLKLYVENVTLFNKWLNETYSTLSFTLTNSGATYTYTWLLPKIKYTGGKLNKPSGGGPIIAELPFVAVYDSTENTVLKITKS